MMNGCIFCGRPLNIQPKCERQPDYKHNALIHKCGTFGVTVTSEESTAYHLDNMNFCNLMLEHELGKKYNQIAPSQNITSYYYDEHESDDTYSPNRYNLAKLMRLYPSSIGSRLEHIILNLAHCCPEIGKTFHLNSELNRLLFCNATNDDLSEQTIMWQYLIEAGYAKNPLPYEYLITIQGWQKIEQLRSSFILTNQGFIAMSYDASVMNIQEAFKSAISKSGYTPLVMSAKQHNNQIIPEMYGEIKHSRFLVVDISRPNLGAYYEAGYAHALEKEVIICCKKDNWDKHLKQKLIGVVDGKDSGDLMAESKVPHFDIAQRPVIVWSTIEELIEMLYKRILHTVGPGSKYHTVEDQQ